MPVKVRCSGCQTVLNAPDKARGKAVKCPKCETRVRVPSGRPRKKKVAQTAPPSDDFLSNVDLSDLEDQQNRICQKCGTALDPDDIECPNCGIDLATGQLTKKALQKRSRRGPDPAEFYKVAWSDSWEFLKTNRKLAVRTALFWTLFYLLSGFCGYMSAFYCTRIPPRIFWGALALICYLGIPGWYWFLTLEVIKATVLKKKKMKRVSFDFMMCSALGVKALFWPIILILPFAWFPPAWLLPIVCMPLAMIHMTMKYTYKAYLPWDMTKIFFKNAGPTLYLLMMAFVLNLLTIVAFALLGLVFRTSVIAFGESTFISVAEWAMSLVGSTGFMASVARGTVALIAAVVIVTPTMFIIAIPQVFLMRTIGLLAYYNKPTLDFVTLTKQDVPAGFWIRYLAHMIDYLVINCAIGLLYGIFWVAIWILVMMEASGVVMPLQGLFNLLSAVFVYLYFTRSESGPAMGTIGKHSLGLVVTTTNGKRISFGQANGRFFGKFLSAIPLLMGFFMCGFTEKKQTLHDTISKTLVVWKGDRGA